MKRGMEAETDWDRALAWRLGRQFLLSRAPASDLVAVIGRVGGLHAQVLSSSVGMLAARVDNVDSGTLAEALWSTRSVVKLWVMRGTLHILPAADHPIWVAGMDMYRNAYAHYGMRDPALLELADVIGAVLHDRVLSRAELAQEVRATGHVAPPVTDLLEGSWGSALKPASFLGHLCYGPNKAGSARFTNPSTWLSLLPPAPSQTDALREIARRYFGVYAPATTQDLAAWWGVSARLAARLVTLIRPELAELQIENRSFWMLRAHLDDLLATPPLSVDEPIVRLLPSFDPWVVAGNRHQKPGIGNPTLDPSHRSAVYRQQGWVSPVITVNGRIVGTWAFAGPKRRSVTLTTFAPLGRRARTALDRDVHQLHPAPSTVGLPVKPPWTTLSR